MYCFRWDVYQSLFHSFLILSIFFACGHLFVRRTTFAGIYHRERLTSCIILHSQSEAEQKWKEKRTLSLLLNIQSKLFSESVTRCTLKWICFKLFKKILNIILFIKIPFCSNKWLNNVFHFYKEFYQRNCKLEKGANETLMTSIVTTAIKLCRLLHQLLWLLKTFKSSLDLKKGT